MLQLEDLRVLLEELCEEANCPTPEVREKTDILAGAHFDGYAVSVCPAVFSYLGEIHKNLTSHGSAQGIYRALLAHELGHLADRESMYRIRELAVKIDIESISDTEKTTSFEACCISSRAAEYEADAFAAKLLGKRVVVYMLYAIGHSEIGHALSKAFREGDPTLRTHPSLNERINHLIGEDTRRKIHSYDDIERLVE